MLERNPGKITVAGNSTGLDSAHVLPALSTKGVHSVVLGILMVSLIAGKG